MKSIFLVYYDSSIVTAQLHSIWDDYASAEYWCDQIEEKDSTAEAWVEEERLFSGEEDFDDEDLHNYLCKNI